MIDIPVWLVADVSRRHLVTKTREVRLTTTKATIRRHYTNTPDSRAPLLKLPAELFYTICNHLDVCDMICLALTCKGMAGSRTGFAFWADIGFCQRDAEDLYARLGWTWSLGRGDFCPVCRAWRTCNWDTWVDRYDRDVNLQRRGAKENWAYDVMLWCRQPSYNPSRPVCPPCSMSMRALGDNE